MGFGGISTWQLLVLLAIILVIFGTRKFRNMGKDLGGAVKDFKKSIGEDEDSPNIETDRATDDGQSATHVRETATPEEKS